MTDGDVNPAGHLHVVGGPNEVCTNCALGIPSPSWELTSDQEVPKGRWPGLLGWPKPIFRQSIGQFFGGQRAEPLTQCPPP